MSADRPMYGGQIVRDRALMDEPTIDCKHCSAAGVYELALYRLNDQAEWLCIGRTVICDDHQQRLLELVKTIRHYERLVVMTL